MCQKLARIEKKLYLCTAFPKGGTRGLSYGVMVAQQVLVLFVLVRIQVGQLKK